MDYTTAALVKTALGATTSTDDAQLGTIITAVSRAIDRKCSGGIASNDYFKSETKTEILPGKTDADGKVNLWPHKPTIDSVSALSYQLDPLSGAVIVDPALVWVQNTQVQAYLSLPIGTKARVTITYVGGLASSQAGLPADLIEAATVLSVRYYKEVKGGLSDSIGVADLGQLIYTKAWPVRVMDMLLPYRRVVPW